MLKNIKNIKKENKKYNLLFISSDSNYFIDTTASFYRMYQNLIHFHDSDAFNVFVLQPDDNRHLEKESLKKGIKIFYYKQLKIINNKFIHFIDFNPFFIIKVFKIINSYQINLIHVDYVYGINILKILTKVPICYNAYNVEAYYYQQTGKYYYKIPFFLRNLYAKYIYFLEKKTIDFVSTINAISDDDKKIFLRMYNFPKDKLFVNKMGYKKEIFEYPINQKDAREKLNLKKDLFIIVFHGSYFINEANKEAIKIIYNKIAIQIKDEKVLFLLAGEKPPLKNKKNIKFIGFVKDLRYFLYAADIAITPIFRGSGIRIKMIDYLSAKLPIISTKQAVLGLTFKNKIHGYIVNDNKPIDDMVEKIIELKNNPEKIKRFKMNIKLLLEDKYNWDAILSKLEFRYREILEKG